MDARGRANTFQENATEVIIRSNDMPIVMMQNDRNTFTFITAKAGAN